MACNNINNTCVEEVNSRCVTSEATLPKRTKITDKCVTQHEVNEDHAAILDEIGEQIDTAGITSDCGSVPEGSDNKSVLQLLWSKACALENKVEKKVEGSITEMNLDFKCLTTDCGESITTEKELFQALIDMACQNNTTL